MSYLGPLAAAAYVALCAIICYAALRNRREGWWAGFLLAVLLLTLPVWTVGLMWLLGILPTE